MKVRTRHVVIAGAITVIGAGIGLAAVAAGGDDSSDGENEVPIVGADLERASSVALAHTGEGRVTETEVGDEESYYEVEVTLDDGSEVDVQLDENFNVVSAADDHDDTADDD